MVVATSTYVIDTPWKLTAKGLMGRMLSYRGHTYRDLEYISPLLGSVCYWRDVSSLDLTQDQQGTLVVGEAAHSCCASEQFLDFLP